jgi:hypothetical protein
MKKFPFPVWIAVVFVCALFLIFATSVEQKNKITREGTPQFFPAKIDFAGEETPLQLTDVRERLDRELLVNANLDASTLLIIKRANRVFPIIEPILQRKGVPDDFKYLAVAESGLRDAISPSNAVGKWKFLKTTAQGFGLKVNEEIDERYHLVKSTEAACAYFNQAFLKYGNWTAVAASYNMGMAGYQGKVNEQLEDNYYNLWE